MDVDRLLIAAAALRGEVLDRLDLLRGQVFLLLDGGSGLDRLGHLGVEVGRIGDRLQQRLLFEARVIAEGIKEVALQALASPVTPSLSQTVGTGGITAAAGLA